MMDKKRYPYLFSAILSVATCLLIFSTTSQVSAWGGTGHIWQVYEAIKLIPDTEAAFFQHNQEELMDRVMDPDRRKSESPDERQRHYLDIEDYVRWGLKVEDFPWTEEEARETAGDENMADYGTAPWAIAESYERLVDALRRHDRHGAIRYASDLAHYVGDVHNPLHTTTNYDGQKTGNRGIHSRYEIEMLDRHIDEILSPIGKPQIIEDIDVFTFAELKASHAHLDAILEADRRATWEPGIYDKYYYDRLWADLEVHQASAMQRAAIVIASYYYTAALEAAEQETTGDTVVVVPWVGEEEKEPTPPRNAASRSGKGILEKVVGVFAVLVIGVLLAVFWVIKQKM